MYARALAIRHKSRQASICERFSPPHCGRVYLSNTRLGDTDMKITAPCLALAMLFSLAACDDLARSAHDELWPQYHWTDMLKSKKEPTP